MTPLESKITALLVELDASFPAVHVSRVQRWQKTSKTAGVVVEVDEPRQSLALELVRLRNSLTGRDSYVSAKDTFERDPVFRDGIELAGYWSTFDAVLQRILIDSATITRARVSIDHSAAIESFRSFRKTLAGKHLEFLASARIIGLRTKQKLLLLPDNMQFYRLSRRQANLKQPAINAFGFNDGDMHLLDHNVELRVPVIVPVNRAAQHGIFTATNEARGVALNLFRSVIGALMVCSSGRLQIGALNLEGGLQGIPAGRSIEPRETLFLPEMTIGTNDLAAIRIAYEFVTGGRGSDKTLSRALHRFILGRQRSDLHDRVVDYVIALESILLTQDGNAITQELTYRFAINGAILLWKAKAKESKNELFLKLKGAYKIRSIIVHGGSSEDIDKVSRAVHISSVAELSAFLESSFRRALFWLAEHKPQDRPYKAHGGWEELLLG
jgi:Apea-like HEPN